MYSQLGDIKFDGQFGISEYEDTGQTKYAEIDLIGGKPDLQHTGEELDVITIQVRLSSSFCNPEIRYNDFHTHRKNGDILPFVDGYGSVIGNFVIEKIKRNVNQTDINGKVVLCECDISLKEYVDPNRAATLSSNARDKAFALTTNSLALNISGPPANANADIVGSLANLKIASGSASSSINQAAGDTANQLSYFKSAAASAKTAHDSAVQLQARVEDYISHGVSTYTGIVSGLVAVENSAAALQAAISANNLAAASAAADTFLSATDNMELMSLPIQQLLILR